MSDPGPSPFKYHLELTPAQLRLTYDGLQDLLAGLGEDRVEARKVIAEVIEKFPDERAIAAIRIDDDGEPDPDPDPDPGRPEPPDSVA
jgi:hypothetical protein